MSSASESQKGSPFHLFSTYPFQSDEVYQQGLASLIAAGSLEGKSEQEKEAILHRSRVFYFNRITGHSISEEEARPSETPLAVEAAPTTTTASVQETPGDVLTFDQLKDLIERGKADLIPNNRHIPEGLNESLPSQSKASLRPKPWEK